MGHGQGHGLNMAQSDEIRSTIQKRDSKGRVRHGAEWLQLWSDPQSMRTKEEVAEDRARLSERRAFGRQLAAAGRGVADDAAFAISLSDLAGQAGLTLGPDTSPAEQAILRGRADSLALFARYHDPAVHSDLRPSDAAPARLFDLLEGLRCDALGARPYPGIEVNIRRAQIERLDRLDLLGAHLASLIPLAEALRMVVRDSLTARREPSIETAGFLMWDRWLRARVGPELAALAARVDDQRAFGAAALDLIGASIDALGGNAEGPRRRSLSDAAGENEEGEGAEAADGDEGRPGDAMFAEEAEEVPPELLAAAAASMAEPPAPYKAWSTAWDEVVHASAIGRTADARAARLKMEEKRAVYRRDLARLVVQLQRRLLSLQRRSWLFDLEEGLIDAARLDRVILNPGFADAYKAEDESPFRDTSVTLLIDNSGSMRGKPIELACIAADMIASALEKCSVGVEILGFTTADWRGGKPAKDWARSGRPAEPGRLNALRHIIYKSADEPLRRTRDSLSLMLSDDLLKENVDGEALAWAARRLAQRAASRKVLIVISDGAPVDEATLRGNSDPRILDRHLREVIGQIERAGQIELAAIGIKHDVSRTYRNAVVISRAEDLGARLVGLLDRMIVN